MKNYNPQVLSATSLIGDEVVNPKGERLGEIKELMIDLHSGHVAYAVLSFGGFLGMGDRLFALPWEAFAVDTESKSFVLDVDKETLENAPGFDKDNWPKTPNLEFISGMYAHYGYEPYYERNTDDLFTRERPPRMPSQTSRR